MSQGSNKFETSVSAGICLEVIPGKLVMVRQRDGQKWGIPAGKMIGLESPVATMYRELDEETGVISRRVKRVEMLGVYSVINGQESTSIGHVFRAVLDGTGGLKPKDEDIDRVDIFEMVFLEYFVNNPNLLYKPRFNQRVLIDWMNNRRNLVY